MDRSTSNILLVAIAALFINTILARPSSFDEKKDNTNERIVTFEQFKEHFNKHYDNATEEEVARENFEKSKQWIARNEHNINFKIGITSVADQSVVIEDQLDEITKFVRSNRKDSDWRTLESIRNVTIPEHFDWREHIRMSPVVEQGDCGSCWAHVSAAMMEANLALHHNISVVLSVQELIDCTEMADSANLKCQGGHTTQGWRYVMLYGIHAEKDYPLVNKLHDTKAYECRTDVTGKKYHIKGYDSMHHPSKDEEIQRIMLKYGPVSAFIMGSANEFRFYKAGVLRKISMNVVWNNHEVVIVGWGHDSAEGSNYWIIRNSWGTLWGEKGYARIQRGHDLLGINEFPSYLL